MSPPPDPEDVHRRFRWIELLALVAIVAVIAAVAVPNLLETRWTSNSGAAIQALRRIHEAQEVFKSEDREKDGNLDYGTLAELSAPGANQLIDSVLGSGTKTGFFFEVTYGATSSEFLWYAVANPVLPGQTAHRSLCTNQEGVVFYTVSGPFRLNDADCRIPPGVPRVGQR